MSMQNTISRQSQRSLLGFGLELADSLNRHASWRLSGDPALNEKAKLMVERDYLSWFNKWPHKDHVCFADITFFSPDHVTVADALTILFVPEIPGKPTAHLKYTKLLDEEYTKGGEGHTMAPHDVFANGLPMCDGIRTPETAHELRRFFTEVSQSSRSIEVENGFLWARVQSDEPMHKRPARIRSADRKLIYAAGDMKTYGKVKDNFTTTFASRVSNEPITDQFNRWVQMWENHASDFKSRCGLPIEHILAVPVGFRSPDNPHEYTAVACLFLGIDNGIRPSDVRETLRYAYLHILESNATSWLLRKGALMGRDAAIVPASHELLRVINAIRPGLSSSAFELLRGYFKTLLIPNDQESLVRHALVRGKNGAYLMNDLLVFAIGLASRIQELSLLAESKSGELANVPENQLDALLDKAESSVRSSISIDNSALRASIRCSAEQMNYFALSILGTLRNSIRHSRLKGMARYRIRIENGHPARLIAENEFCDDHHQSEEEGKATGGTLNALRAYARGYGADPRLVSLKRADAGDSTDPLLNKREIWRTILPVPGDLLQ